MADQKSGSFSDLYEVMQERKAAPAAPPTVRRPAAAIQPPIDMVPASSRREGGKEGKKETEKETSQPRKREGGKPAFDLSERPYRKDSFLFTDAEFHALEQLKLDLRSKHDLPTSVTKNDLARCAIGHMLADYRERGEGSYVIHSLRAKGAK